ncbi:MAG TPA: hypothetical protein VKR55_03855 [Bradyrhizobium sp.]|nr:hypothetical protein [Bradyrhizobium sp.]HLZ01270.1 hypothetical protein [Bradyrhizobium sp.]
MGDVVAGNVENAAVIEDAANAMAPRTSRTALAAFSLSHVFGQIADLVPH